MTGYVLTCRRPWGSLIIWGGKTTEVRSWPTRYRGLLWIHQGLGTDRPGIDLPPGLPMPAGYVIGHVQLTGVTQAAPGVWHWHLRDPVPLDVPVRARGRQSLWRPPESLSRSLADESVRVGPASTDA